MRELTQTSNRDGNTRCYNAETGNFQKCREVPKTGDLDMVQIFDSDEPMHKQSG